MNRPWKNTEKWGRKVASGGKIPNREEPVSGGRIITRNVHREAPTDLKTVTIPSKPEKKVERHVLKKEKSVQDLKGKIEQNVQNEKGAFRGRILSKTEMSDKSMKKEKWWDRSSDSDKTSLEKQFSGNS